MLLARSTFERPCVICVLPRDFDRKRLPRICCGARLRYRYGSSMVSQETPRLLFVHAHPTTKASPRVRLSRTTALAVPRCGWSPAHSAKRVKSSTTSGPSWPSTTRTNSAATASVNSLLRCVHSAPTGRSFSAARAAGATPACRHPTAAPAEVRRRRQTRNRRRARGRHPRIASSRRRDLRPQRGYGHPDHVHTHLVTTAAVAAAGSADYPARRGGCRRCTGP
ncbi:putative 1D-myo-inositol 2-acetamido-2-deoxy-alpha-D-glucopyranoside deacetylase [Mycobacterium xenopi 3993]|nr:putative 1D-myo-inositol 2-acetamido-2-deoxy-alpha-D-glucopyranoside deacetylase [Mycobacterium xenopi 3993]